MVGIIAASAALRLLWLDYPQLWLDELIQLRIVTAPTLGEMLEMVVADLGAVPLDHLVQRPFVLLLGPWEWGARLHAAIFGILAVPAIFMLARRLLSGRLALTVALLWAVFPLHVFYSREGRSYSLWTLLTIVGFWLLLAALQRNRTRDWVGVVLLTVLQLYANYLGLVTVLLQLVLVAAWGARPGLREGLSIQVGALSKAALSLATGLICFAPWLLLAAAGERGAGAENYFTAAFWLRILKESSGGYPLSVLLIAAAATGVTSLGGKRSTGPLALLTTWIGLTVIGVLTLAWSRDYFVAIRHLLAATPALVILAACGLSRAGRFQAAALGLIIVLSIGTVGLSDHRAQEDWKALTRYLESTPAGDRIAAPQIEPVISFRFTQWQARQTSLAALARAPKAGLRVHLIRSKYMTPEQQRAAAALLAGSEVISSHTFRGFQVDVLEVGGS